MTLPPLPVQPFRRQARLEAEPLRLRILGTPRHGQLLDVASARCTVGSAAACNLRLRAPGVRPIHCLILRSSDGYTVRSLSSDTLLNGRAFREQSLRPGDRLQIGPIALEVVGGSVATPPPRAAALFSRPEQPAGAPHEAIADAAAWASGDDFRASDVLARIERLERDVETALPAYGGTPRSFGADASPAAPGPAASPGTAAETAASTGIKDERQRLEAERGRLEAEREKLAAELARKTEEWSLSRQRLEEHLAEWESTRQHSQKELDELRCELARQQQTMSGATEALRDDVARLTRDLERERENLAEARRTWDADRSRMEASSEAARARCDELEQLLAEKTEFHQRERQRWDDERTALLSDLAAQRARCQELEQSRDQLQQECERLACRVSELETQAADRLARAGGSGSPLPVAMDPVTRPAPAASAAPAAPPSLGRERDELRWLATRWAETQADPIPDNHRDPATSVDPPSSCAPRDEDASLAGLAAAGVDCGKVDRCEPFPMRRGDDQDHLARSGDDAPSDPPSAALSESGDGRELAAEPPCELPTPGLSAPPEMEASDPSQGDSSEGDVDDDVFERLRRAGIWRHADRMPSAFDAETDAAAQDQWPDTTALRDRPEPRPLDAADGDLAGVPGDQPAGSGEMTAKAPAADERLHERSPASADGVPPASGEAGREDGPVDAHDISDAVLPGGVADDDSIEAYMQRLLGRVRGGAVPAAAAAPMAAAAPSPERTPISEIELPAEDSPQAATKSPLALDEYVPRSQAPELNADLAAMRELANTTRRTHLISHAHRTSSSKSRAKLLGSLACTSVATASVFHLDAHPSVAVPALVLSSGVALWFAIQALAVRRKVFDALRLDTEYLNADRDREAPSAGGSSKTAAPTDNDRLA